MITPYFQDAHSTIYHADCRDVLEEWEGLRTQSFDLLLTDPPYGISADRIRGSARFGWVDYPVNGDGWDAQPIDIGTLIACKNTARRSVIWGGNYFPLPPSMGWLIWDKGQRDFSLADAELAWTSERVAVRVFNYSRAEALKDGKTHPTQKPERLMEWVLGLTQFKATGSVFDPFMGSGTTLVAAKRLGKQATGIECEERYCEIAANRLSQGVLSDMFV